MKFIAVAALAAATVAVAAPLDMSKAMSLVSPSNLGVTIAYCGGYVQNFVASVDPADPAANQNFTTTFDYDLDREVMGGKAKYSATLNGLPFSQTDDLCADQAGSADPCPLQPGHHHDTSVTAFPDFTGKLVSTIDWTDQNGDRVLCVTFTWRV